MSEPTEASEPASGPPLTRYQRYVVFCAWVGIGFDLMDSILFNFVAPIALPDLLGLTPGTPEARAQTGYWNGILTSVMLAGWAVGGIAFGRVADRIGRTRTVILTMLVYSLGTAACAFAPDVYTLAAFRVITALGIGGEWAAGATLVAETVPERKRVQMGTLLFTAPPFFVFLGIFVSWLFTKQIHGIASDPSLSWRLVLGFGGLPAIVALILRRGLHEPQRWTDRRTKGEGASEASGIRALFTPELRKRTIGGVLIATVALVTFWVVTAFIPIVASFLAQGLAPSKEAMPALSASFVTRALAWFNGGGLVGSLVAAPLALRLGRRRMYFVYFAWSAVSVALAFGLSLSPQLRLASLGVVGLSVYGVFATFQFYFPELYPTHLRGLGAGFCLNSGRFLTVLGPFAVGAIVQRGVAPLDVLPWVAIVPALGVVMLALGVGAETKGEKLA
jgi:MFS family permease